MMNDSTNLSQRCALPAKGSRVLCAVSGGADSMCLLHLLYSLQSQLGIEVFAAHYEHGLRGEDSLRDADFVENWCEEHGIVCTVEHGNVTSYAEEKGLGTEEAARELRYAFLERCAEKLKCDLIATAHNADDNAETVIFNLARGSGIKGLGGIPPRRGQLIRPLLDIPRCDIEIYLSENDIPHVEDATNASDDYTRNIIRHNVSPVLRHINPNYAAAVGRACALLREDEDCLDNMARKFIEESFDGESISTEKLLSTHRAITSRALRLLLQTPLEKRHIESIFHLCESTELGWLDVPGRRLRFERNRIWFAQSAAVSVTENALKAGQSLDLPELGLRLLPEISIFSEEINGLFKTLFFKYDNICGNIICTGRRDGDRLRPAYRNCSKTLKSLFEERKMTQAQRDSALIFRDERGILGIYALTQDERTLPQKGERVLQIKVEKL